MVPGFPISRITHFYCIDIIYMRICIIITQCIYHQIQITLYYIVVCKFIVQISHLSLVADGGAQQQTSISAWWKRPISALKGLGLPWTGIHSYSICTYMDSECAHVMYYFYITYLYTYKTVHIYMSMYIYDNIIISNIIYN